MSGLIFVALAAVWAVILIPMALRHHDEAARTRGVPRLSARMRVVVRRGDPATAAVAHHQEELTSEIPVLVTGQAEARHDAVAIEDTDGSQVTVEIEAVTLASSDQVGPELVSIANRRAAARTAATRRRRVLMGLALAGAVVAGLSVAGVLQPYAPLIPLLMLLVFLVVARLSVRNQHRAEDHAQLVWRQRRELAARVAAAEPLALAHEEPALDLGAPEPSMLDIGLNAADFEALPESGLWDPVPVTLPTYVGKERAARSVRTISLGDPGVSSAGHDVEDSKIARSAEREAAESAQQSPGRHRAVGS